MPKITDVKLAERRPFYEGLEGVIVQAEEVKTLIRGYNGIRVTIKDDNGVEYSEMLWKRPEVGTRSKLGAFMTELGDDTDEWIGKRIKILVWKEKAREIAQVVPKGKK